MYPSTLSSAVLLIAKALDARGLNSKALFFEAGLDPHKLNVAGARYAYAGLTRLWELSIKATGEPSFGLEVARYWHPTSLHALGYAWLASSTLQDALERLVRYIRLVSSDSSFSFENTGDNTGRLRLDTTDPDLQPWPHEAGVDAGVAIILHMCRVSAGEDFAPLKVTLTRAAPNDDQPYLDSFRAPVEFSAGVDAIYFDPASLEIELPTANADLARANDQVIKRYLSRFDGDNITARARMKLTELLPSGEATREKLAQSLYFSSRTFQRRLSEEGTTFQDLLDDARRELALEYMRDPEMSAKAVSYLLGFNVPGNFTRAFRRWTGYSPSEYRNSVKKMQQSRRTRRAKQQRRNRQ